MSIPAPSPDALAHSAELARRIADAIRAAGGWIGFDAWMTRALYEPGLGYYAGPARPFGAEGDFVTAPELSPLFARSVAAQVSQWFAHCDPVVVEFGGGTGRLAAGLLEALDALGTPARRYAIVEVSGPLRERQRDTIARLAPGALHRVEWLDALPDTIDGVVVGNEVLDAMPVRLFEVAGGTLSEVGVELADDAVRSAGGSPRPADDAARAVAARSGGRTDDAPTFCFASRPADAALDGAVRAGLGSIDFDPDGGATDDDPLVRLGIGPYRSEIGEQAAAWVRTVGRALRRGAMLLLDYGFPAREYYHPQRVGGTLVAHRRHRVHDDVLRWPGLQDVTAHVDFSATARAAADAGLELLGYASQARFLINCGLMDALAEVARDGARDVASVRALGAVQTLLSEAEMGELFKAIAFGRGLPADALGFSRGDRSASL